MWNFCDDLGVIRADSVWIKSKIFPFDQMQIQQFDKICQEILRNGFISLFSYRDEKFYYLPKFSLHQKINKPNYEEVNVPKEILFKGLHKITEQSRINHGLITEQSIPKIEEEIEGYIPPIIPQGGVSKFENRLIHREKELEIKARLLSVAKSLGVSNNGLGNRYAGRYNIIPWLTARRVVRLTHRNAHGNDELKLK